MATATDLVARSGDLKRELVEYAQQPRYHRVFREVLRTQGADLAGVDEQRLTMFFDHFVLQHRLRNGKTVVEQFVAARPDLPEAERELLLGWRDVVEGVFAVQRREGEALLVENLVDDLTYQVRSNMGPAVFRQVPRRSFLFARLVPIGAEWLISGAITIFPARDRDRVYRAAAELALHQPALVFRNPDKLARGWELQRAERDRFVRFFGTDMVIIPGDQFAEQMRKYQESSHEELLATLPARRWPRRRRTPTPVPTFDAGPDMADSETVGVIYDEVEGLSFYAELGLVEAVFADPQLLRQRRYKQHLLDYLDDDTVSPLPFRRLAGRDPAKASVLFQKLLRRPRFDWGRDGESLLRERKAEFFDRPPQPSVTPISDRLTKYVVRP
ncbi:MAG TPA: hypothetical protein VFB84_22190 [Micromonosporaceae bacterium]|nr:hypothetical protein [Micromonosporaceae bacterium]